MELQDSIVTPGLNVMTLTVDTLCALKANGNFVGMYNININGTLEDGIIADANLTISKTATVKLDVRNFTDNYEKIEVPGDLIVDSANLEITVTAPIRTNGDQIALLTASNPDIRFKTVTVNGVVIVSNGGTTGIKDTYAGKEIKAIKYFDLFGRLIKEPTQRGIFIVIKQTTYTDGTIRTEKTIFNRK